MSDEGDVALVEDPVAVTLDAVTPKVRVVDNGRSGIVQVSGVGPQTVVTQVPSVVAPEYAVAV